MVKLGFELKKIGDLLKEKRLQKGLDIAQISENIKVRSEYIQALEEGRYEPFASEVFLKGFLTKYSKFLGVSQEKALAMYRRERETVEEKTLKHDESLKKGPLLTLTPGKLVAAVIIGTVLAVLIYIGSQLNEIVRAPELSIREPIELSAGQEGTFTTDSDSVNISGSAEVGSVLTLNGTKVTTNNLQQYQILSLPLNDGENKFILEAESQFGKVSTITLNVVKSSQNSVAEIMTVNITANESIFLTVIADSSELLSANVSRGEKLDFTATEIFTLNTDNLAALSVEINGETMETGSGTTATWEIQDGIVRKI